MIWSILKIILFVGAVAVLTSLAGYLIEAGGEIRVAVGAIEFSLTPLAGVIVLLLMLIAGWVIFRVIGFLVAVLRFLNGDETAISRYFDRSRERRGFEALADGLMALASGEGKLALAKATRAEKYLQRPELTLLISAQAAEMTGETKRAQEFYKQLLKDDRTRFVGIQGILKQKLTEGDTETALKLAEKAFALRPRHEKTMDTLFALQSEQDDWKGARSTLLAKYRAKALPKDVHTRRDAVLALAEARDKIEAGDIQHGTAAVLEANRMSPGLVPAAVLAAEMHALSNAPKAAVKVLKKAWSLQPHPELAAAFADLEPNEIPRARLARFQTLLRLKPEDPESRLLSAELEIAAENFSSARRSMGDLADTDPTLRSLTIMAAIERGEGSDDSVVRGWLTKALGASRGPVWICSSCKHIHGSWMPVCENCASFDTLSWEAPPKTVDSHLHGSEMLPLIVGALERPAAEIPEEAESTPSAPPELKHEENHDVKEYSPEISKESDDMDGIVGDIHTIPESRLKEN